VAVSAGADEVRVAYRRRIRDRHPDRAGAAATDDASAINEAYAVLRAPAAPAPPPAPPASSRPPAPPGWPAEEDEAFAAHADEVTLVDDETMAFAFPADEVFHLLVDVADRIGDITYVDPEAGLLETRVQFVGEPACSVVLSLQGRADRVEAFCTIESLDGTRPPPTSEVVSLLIRSLRERLAHRSPRSSSG